MRVVLQRVARASVTVDGAVVGSIDGPGLCLLVGATHTDTRTDIDRLADKVWRLRVMRDELSASDLGAPILVVSQFTLYADVRKGRRPSWSRAASSVVSEPLVEDFVEALRSRGARVETGRFGADMSVELVNDGPVTILLDSSDWVH